MGVLELIEEAIKELQAMNVEITDIEIDNYIEKKLMKN